MAVDTGPNRATLRTRIQALGYATDSATAQNEAINAALRHIMSLRRWEFQESTLTKSLPINTSELDLSAETTFADIDSFQVLDGTDRLYADYEDHQTFQDRQWEYQGSSGTPIYWTRRGDKILFQPKTDKAYTAELDVLLLAVDLDDDTKKCLVPNRYSDAVVWGAILWMATRQRDNATITYATQNRDTIIRSMLSAYQLKQRDNSTHVKRSNHWTSLGGGTVQWRA